MTSIFRPSLNIVQLGKHLEDERLMTRQKNGKKEVLEGGTMSNFKWDINEASCS